MMRSDRIAQLVNGERFVYFLTTDKAIIMIDRNIKHVEIYTNYYKFVRRKQSGLDHVTYFYILGPPLCLWNG